MDAIHTILEHATSMQSPTQLSARTILDHQLIVRVFLTTNRPEDQAAAATPLLVVPSLTTEPYLSFHHCEDLILARIRSISAGREIEALDFLCACFHRASRETDLWASPNKKNDATRSSVQADICNVVLRYIGNMISMPDFFFEGSVSAVTIAQRAADLLTRAATETGEMIEGQILAGLVREFASQEELTGILNPVIDALVAAVNAMSFTESFAAFTAYSRLLSLPQVIAVLMAHPRWLISSWAGLQLQKESILGGLFGLSPIGDSRVAFNRKDQRALHDTVISVQHALSSHVTSLYGLMQPLMKADTRSSTMAWFLCAINANQGRRMQQPDPKVIATDGFMVNLSFVLLKFAEPFIDATGLDAEKMKRFGLVDDAYMTAAFPVCRVDWRNDTRMWTPLPELRYQDAGSKAIEWKFITECFFMCYRALHLGVAAILDKYEDRDRLIQHLESQLQKMEDDKNKNPAQFQHPVMQMRYADAERRIKEYIEKEWNNKIAIDACFFEKGLLSTGLEFYAAAARWLLNIYHNKPNLWDVLPEHFFEDICEYLSMIRKRYSHGVAEFSLILDNLLSLMLLIAQDPRGHVRNPFLRAKVSDTLEAFLDVNLWERFKHTAHQTIYAILKLYHDCERTNTRSQFYDKFSFRHSLSSVLQFLWDLSDYRSAYIAVSHDSSVFVPFVHALVGDMEYTLDESLMNLQKLHDAEHGSAMRSEADTEVNEGQLRGQIASWMRLAMDNIHLLNYLSEASPDAFLTPEMIDRIASVLGYFLDKLVGEQCTKLRVRNMEELHFKPRALLSEIAACYAHFSTFSSFLEAVVRDGRSYKRSNYSRAATILSDKSMATMAQKLQECEEQTEAADEDLGDAPDEFLDPILSTLMRDPVMLPSGHAIDRSTILRHMLSDPTDPFSRQPLSADALQPAVDLKARIDEWLQSRKK